MLSKTPRSGFTFLGSGKQSVAEHLNRVTYIGYVLSKLIPGTDTSKVMRMCLFHDLAEAKTSDLNYVHQKYAKTDESKVLVELSEELPFGNEIKNLVEEHNAGESIEAKISRDADQLELLLSLKEQLDIGNTRAKTWITPAIKRLKTPEAQNLAEIIIKTDSDHWWFGDKDHKWWVNREKNS